MKRPFLSVRRHTREAWLPWWRARLGLPLVVRYWKVRCRVCGHTAEAMSWRVAMGEAHAHVLEGCVAPRDRVPVLTGELCG